MDRPAERRFFRLLLAIVSVAFCWILLPFFSAVFWGVILALLFMPIQQHVLKLWGGRRNLAALTTLLLCLVIVIIPVIFIAGSLVQEGASVYSRIRSGDLNLGAYVEQIRTALPPSAEQWLHSVGLGDFSTLRDKLSASAMQGSQFLATQAYSIGQNTLQFMVSFGVMLYLLFFLLRDGIPLTRRIRNAIPLNPRQKHQLLNKFIAVTRATVKGNIIVAATQGALGGVTLWLLGIEAPLLWGVVMAFLSLLPAIGAGLIWAPMAIWLIAIGAIAKGIILIVVGVLVIGMVDNVLRPILVGKDTKLPDYVVLISTLGGMALFGINGFVIGPLVAALFISAWDLLATETEEESPNDAPEVEGEPRKQSSAAIRSSSERH